MSARAERVARLLAGGLALALECGLLGCRLEYEPLADAATGADAAMPCADGRRGRGEIDIDCGGPCARCGLGRRCEHAADCETAVCTEGLCAEPSCADGTRNREETDVDCGGPICEACGRGQRCEMAEDCAGGVCTRSLCALPTCFDSVVNASETDVDCGGLGCAPCADRAACERATDCASELCADGHCASCTDGARSGAETDADCGGPLCPACADGAGCALPVDCASGVCGLDLRCTPPRCDDGALNGDESDADCGGACAPCVDGGRCTTGGDCAGGACVGGWCQGGPALLWEKDLLPAGLPPPAGGGASFVTVRAIATGPDSGLVVVADFNARAQLDLDESIDAVRADWAHATLVASFAADGSHRWSRLLGSEYVGLGEGASVAVGSDGTVYVGGRVQLASGARWAVDLGGGPRTYPTGDILVFVSAFAPDGTHRWLSTHDAWNLGAMALRDGEIAIGGYDNDGSGGFARAYAANDGSLRWSRSIGEDVHALAFDAAGELHAGVRARPDETVDLGGGVRVRMRNYYNVALLRIGPDGATRGMTASLQSEDDMDGYGPQPARLAVSSGRLHLVGRTSGAVDLGGGVLGAMDGDGFVVVLGTDRSHVWSRLFGSALADGAMSAAAAGDGGMVIGGFFRGTVDFGAGPVVGGGGDFRQPAGFVASYGPRGEHRWSRLQTGLPRSSGSGSGSDVGTLVAIAPDGAVHVAFGSRIQRLAP